MRPNNLKYLTRVKRAGLLVSALMLLSFSASLGQELSGEELAKRPDLTTAERLKVLVGFDGLRFEVLADKKVPKADRSLFLKYLSERFPQEEANFIKSADKGLITENNLAEYKEQLRQKYRAAYESFKLEKNQFVQKIELERAYKNNRVLAANGPCENIDFEDGSTDGWEGATGEATTDPYPDDIRERFDDEFHSIVTAGDVDPLIPELPVVAPGGTYSLRIGNTESGGDATILRQTFAVTETNNIFTYKYATVLEDPGDHDDDQRPYFKVRLYDEEGDEISCGTYTATAKPPIENFTYYPVEDEEDDNGWGGGGGWGGGWGGNNGMMELYYRDWTTVSIPMLDYVGQNVTIEFVVSDCELGGHLGYAYIDGECAALGEISFGTVCEGEETTFKAPEGFAAYSWTGPGIVGRTDTSTVTANAPGTYTVELIPAADNPCPEELSFEVLPYCEGEDQEAELCESIAGSGIAQDVELTDYDSLMVGDNSSASVLSWHSETPISDDNKLTNTTVNTSSGEEFYALVNITDYYVDTLALTFTINAAPEIDFPAIPAQCMDGSEYQISGTTPAGGAFSGPNVSSAGLFALDTAGSFDIQYKVTTTAGCSDSLVQPLVVNKPDTAKAGPDEEICEDEYALQANSEVDGTWKIISGSGTFSDPNNPNATVSGLSTGENKFEWSVSVDACPPSADTVTIYKYAPLTVPNAGPDDTVCVTDASYNFLGNDPDTDNGESVEWKSLNGLSLSSANTPATTAQSLSAGVYGFVYSINHDLCPDLTDTVNLQVDKAVTQQVATSVMTCENAVQISASPLNPATATGNWVITDGQGSLATATSATTNLSGLSDPDTTYLTWTAQNGVCPPKSVDITVGKPGPVTKPTISFRGNDYTNDTITLCQEESGPFNLLATVPGTQEAASWAHISGNSASIPEGSSPGQALSLLDTSVTTFEYEIKGTLSENCPTEKARVTVDINKAPETPGPITGNTDICTPATGEIYKIPVTPGAAEYTWSVPSGASFTAINDTAISVDFSAASVNGSVEVSVENSCGVKGPATLAVTSAPKVPVSVTLTGPDSVCFGQDIPDFVATPTNPGSDPGYSWELNSASTGSDNPGLPLENLQPGSYNVKVTLKSSETCPTPADGLAEDEATLVILPKPQIIVETNDPTVCEGNGSVVLGGLEPNTLYELNYKDPAAVGPLNSTTDGQGEIMLSLPEGTYSDIQVSRFGCKGNIEQAVLDNPVIVPEISLSPETSSICSGETVAFSASPVNGGDAPAYKWMLNGTPFSHTGTAYSSDSLKNGDVITVELTSSSPCASPATVQSNPALVMVNELPDAAITGPASFCKGEKVNLTATGGQNGSDYQWYFNGEAVSAANKPFLNANKPGYYSVKISNGKCTDLSGPHNIESVEVVVDAGPDQTVRITDHTEATIDVRLHGTTNGSNPVWAPAAWLTDAQSLAPGATLPAGNYAFTLTDSIGECTASDIVHIKVQTKIWIPTAISPNGDGANERWFIRGLEGYDRYEINVYNRYGNVVHTQEDSYEPWDGYRNGQPMPVGTYYFVVNVPDDDVYTGNLTIVR